MSRNKMNTYIVRPLLVRPLLASRCQSGSFLDSSQFEYLDTIEVQASTETMAEILAQNLFLQANPNLVGPDRLANHMNAITWVHGYYDAEDNELTSEEYEALSLDEKPCYFIFSSVYLHDIKLIDTEEDESCLHGDIPECGYCIDCGEYILDTDKHEPELNPER